MMKPKKNKKSDLNNYTTSFILIGLIVSLFTALKLINMETLSAPIDLDSISAHKTDIDTDKVIKIEEAKPLPHKVKPKIIAKLEIVKNDTKKVESELLPTDPDDDINQKIDSIQTVDVEEPDVEYPWKFVEQVPTFPGCKGNKVQMKKCLNEKINRFINRNFNADIAQDLGLSGERVRIFTQFTIDKDGRIIHVKTRSKYKDLEKEAGRVIQQLPRMIPGKQRNRPVRVTYTLPIVFDVAE